MFSVISCLAIKGLFKFVLFCLLTLFYVTSCHTILVHCAKIRYEIQLQYRFTIILLYNLQKSLNYEI